MKIAIDVRALMEGRRTGVEEYTVQVTQALKAVAPQHQYVLFYNAAKPVQLPPQLSSFEQFGLRYPNKIFNAAQGVLHWPKWDQLVEADCFFIPNFRPFALSIATPLVTTVHDLSFEHFPEFYSRKRRLWHTVMQSRALMENSDHLIAVSEATARDVESRYGISRRKISVIHSGVAPLELSRRNSISYVRHKYHLSKPYLLFFGTLEPRKNIVSIIQAFSTAAASIPHDLVVAGSPGWLMQAIDNAAAHSPVRERIHVIKLVDEADKWSLYAAADLFVYPSFYEGFGFPPLESLVSGTPVITSYNSSLPEIVGKWATLVDPYNVGELAGVIKELLAQPTRVSPAVQQEILTHYSWRNTAERTLEVIESVT